MNTFKNLTHVLLGIEVSSSSVKILPMQQVINDIVKLIRRRIKAGKKVIFVGNGGSASIASHMQTDFLKNAQVPALAFNDSSLLTCLSNDYGYKYVFEKPLAMMAAKGDILFAISSSGKSENILRAVSKAKEKGCDVITLSGFSPANSLRKKGMINFYAHSCSYGDVEIAHLAILHSIVDRLCKKDG